MNNMINYLPKFLREDEYIKELLNSVSVEIIDMTNLLKKLYNNYDFTKMDNDGRKILAKQLDIQLNPNLSDAEKNSVLEAKFKSTGMCDVNLIRNVCNSFENGEVDVKFTDGVIEIKFISDLGRPENLLEIKKAVNEIIPVFLSVNYTFKYLTINEVEALTLAEIEAKQLKEFAPF